MNRAAEPYRKVVEVVNGFQGARMLHLAVGLDLFTRLANEGKSATQIAATLHVDAHALELLLDALASLGFLRREDDRFRATAVSQTYLARGGPRFLGHLVAHQARRWKDWERLDAAIRSGAPGIAPAPAEDDAAALEDRLLAAHELAMARGEARQFARFVPLRRCRSLIDVGGAPGTLAALCCRAYPSLQATIVDLPDRIAVTRRLLQTFDLTARVAMHAADPARDPIPGGPYDAVLVANGMLALQDDAAPAFFERLRAALVPGGLLVLKRAAAGADWESQLDTPLSRLLRTALPLPSATRLSAWTRAAGFESVVEMPRPLENSDTVLLAQRPGGRPVAALATLIRPPSPAPAAPNPAAFRGDWSQGASAFPPAPPARRRIEPADGARRASARNARARPGRAPGRKSPRS
jgi:SAM-dependent methyltransferase